jgi:hypothetical protein
MPGWAKGFSIVRTESAGQVVGQGLAFYKLNSSGGSFGAGTTKTPNMAWVHIPDIDPITGINPEWYNEFISSPSNFQVRVEAPFGFFDEVYNFKSGTFGASDTHIDMMLHARHMKETFNANTNKYDVIPYEESTVGIGSGLSERHIAFGKWRRSTPQLEGPFANAQNNTKNNPRNIKTIFLPKENLFTSTINKNARMIV